MNNVIPLTISKLKSQRNTFNRCCNSKKINNKNKNIGNKNIHKGNFSYSNLLTINKNYLSSRGSKNIEKYLNTSQENELTLRPNPLPKKYDTNKKDDKLIYTLKSLNLENLIPKFINNMINFNDIFLLSKQDMNEMKLSALNQEKLINFSNEFLTYGKYFTMEELKNYFESKKSIDLDYEYHNFETFNQRKNPCQKLKKNESLKLIEGLSIIVNKDDNNQSREMLMRDSSAKNIIITMNEYNKKNIKENTKFSTNQNSLDDTEKLFNSNNYSEKEENIFKDNNCNYNEKIIFNEKNKSNHINNIKKSYNSFQKNIEIYNNINYNSYRPLSKSNSIGKENMKKRQKIKNMKRSFKTKLKESSELIEHSENILLEINKYQLSYEEMRKRSNERNYKIQTLLSNVSPSNKLNINISNLNNKEKFERKQINSSSKLNDNNNNNSDYIVTKLNPKYMKISSEQSLSNYDNEIDLKKNNKSHLKNNQNYKNDLIGIKIVNQPKIIKDSKNLFETYKNLIPQKSYKKNNK